MVCPAGRQRSAGRALRSLAAARLPGLERSCPGAPERGSRQCRRPDAQALRLALYGGPPERPVVQMEARSRQGGCRDAVRSEERRVGRGVSVRVDFGGRRIIKKKK